VSVFVSDELMNELVKPPFRWFGPELMMRVLRDDHSLLSDKEIAEANSTDGLNLVAWDACVGVEDLMRPKMSYAVMSAFIENHRGFLLRRLIAQANSAEHMQQVMEAGGRLLRPNKDLPSKIPEKKTMELVREPHVLVMDREFALQRPGSWVASLFFPDTPKIGFSRSEQSLLLAALRGGADAELADDLGVSRSAVKKAWHSIYERAAGCDANLLPPVYPECDNGTARGKQKRHHLLSYLRDHPEELRPISRRLLRSASRDRRKYPTAQNPC
jgi:hypothetical protein